MTSPDEMKSLQSVSASTSEFPSQPFSSGWKNILTDRYPLCIVPPNKHGDMTGKELRQIRDRLGLTQAALADRLGVSPNSVARWERDEVPIREPMARLTRLLARTEPKANPKRRR